MNQASRLKQWIPPALLPLARKLTGRSLKFCATPQSWHHAVEQSKGYADAGILNRVAQATRLVVAGKAAYERDGMVFAQPDFPYPLVAMLLHAASSNNGCLEVVDFGGALGSTYWQIRPLLQNLREVKWHVIEQPNFVALGKSEFESTELQFHRNVAEIPGISNPKRVLLLSSVLQYLEDPITTLTELLHHPFSHVIIDRTPVSSRSDNVLCIQKVPAYLFAASYPCWILSKEILHRALASQWVELVGFSTTDGEWVTSDGVDFEFRGICFLPK